MEPQQPSYTDVFDCICMFQVSFHTSILDKRFLLESASTTSDQETRRPRWPWAATALGHNATVEPSHCVLLRDTPGPEQ